MSAAADEPTTDEPVDVLFIEDDPDLAELYEMKLHLDGYRVHTIRADSRKADSAEGDVPDILFVDVKSFDGPGASALTTLHADRRLRDVPKVVLSSCDAEKLRAHGVELGDLDYLVPV